MTTYPTTKLDRAVDEAITAENKRVEAELCPNCAGTGTTYVPTESDIWHQRQCRRCKGTGRR